MSAGTPDSDGAPSNLDERIAAGVATAEEIFASAQSLEDTDPAMALLHYGKCAAMVPDWAAPVAKLGDVLRKRGREEEALVAYGRALELDPGDADTFLKRGNLLNERRHCEDAVEDYDAAARIRPDWYLPHLNKGNALAAAGDLEAARNAYGAALERGGPAGIRLRRSLLLPIIPASREGYAAAHDRYAAALKALEQDPPQIDNPLTETPGSRFYLAYHGENERVLQERLAAVYRAGCPGLDWTAPHCRSLSRPKGPRRIAFVSRFLFDHSIGRLCLGLLRRLASRADCEVLCFETAEVPDDELHREIATLAAHRETLPASVTAARERIAAAAPDVVFYPEIGMDPLVYFLAFARLAPVQCVTWGHPITSGLRSVDYFLSCAAAESDDPEDWEAEYIERLVPLGGLLASYVRPAVPDPLGTRADFGLSGEATIYFLAQNLFKIHPDMDAPLKRILEDDPQAVLLLLEGHDPSWGRILRERFAETLGNMAGRVIFLPRQSHEDFMRLLALSDVSLDSFPFCGGNTTYQSLAMGTPVVTLPGDYLRGRPTAAIYALMGMDELVAKDAPDYARIAVRLGTEPAFRSIINRRIQAASDVIFEDQVFLDEAEAFLMAAKPLSR